MQHFISLQCVDFIEQVAIVRHAGLALFFITGGETKPAVSAAATHGFHHCGDDKFPALWRMTE